MGLAVLSAAAVEQRLKDEERKQRYEEERRQREAAARAKYMEERRGEALVNLLKEVDELDRLRYLHGALAREVDAAGYPRVDAMLKWAADDVARREARLSAEALEGRLLKLKLFGEDDDDFRPRGW